MRYRLVSKETVPRSGLTTHNQSFSRPIIARLNGNTDRISNGGHRGRGVVALRIQSITLGAITCESEDFRAFSRY